uniref:Sulfotransferase n=1 Tax=Terrapene triunguis TaxID=2587831 RepID=A0A674KB33_9SAUR
MTTARKKFIERLDQAMATAEKMAPEDLLCSYKGVLYPVTHCSAETFKALESFEARSDDVLLVGYPKTGEYIVFFASSENSVRRIKKLSSRRVFATHVFPHMLPTSIFKNNVKILMVIRNPKDIAVSYFHFSNSIPSLPSFKTWDEFFNAFLNGKVSWGSYFDHIIEWNKHFDDENIMFITYEELKENSNLGVKKIAEFFGFSVTNEESQAVADRNSFQTMKENSHKTHGAFGNVLFRKGSVSDWKNLFTEAQNQEMDKKFEESLAGTKLGAKIKYGVYCKA